jgi:hypothetical protein
MAPPASGHLGNRVLPQRFFLQSAFGVSDDDLVVLQQVVHNFRTNPVFGAAGTFTDPVGRKERWTSLPFPLRAQKSVFAQGPDRKGERGLFEPAAE